MVSLSLCMMVKNEEQCLERCLRSVKELVDEIIIIDTGSTDATEEIAREFTTKIYNLEWPDDFSAARNESIRHATSDWILVLDADETIDEKDHSVIKQAISDSSPEIAGFWLVRKNYVQNQAQIQNEAQNNMLGDNQLRVASVDSIIRLFRNRRNIVFRGAVHEVVTFSNSPSEKVEFLDVPIHHHKELRDDMQHKRPFYERLALKKIDTEQDHHAYWELGRDYLHQKRVEEAIILLKKAVEKKEDFFPAVLTLGNAYLMKKDYALAREYLNKARSLNQGHYFLYFGEGLILAHEGKQEEALQQFLKAIPLAPKEAAIHFQIGLCFDKLGDTDKAYLAFKNAIELDPKYKGVIGLEE